MIKMTKLKKPMVLLLVLTIMALGVTPGFAQVQLASTLKMHRTPGQIHPAPRIENPSGMVLPQGQLLQDDELVSVQGKGGATTLVAGIGGAIAGAGYYAGSYVYKRATGQSTSLDWKNFGEAAFAGAVSSAIFATVTAWWAP